MPRPGSWILLPFLIAASPLRAQEVAEGIGLEVEDFTRLGVTFSAGPVVTHPRIYFPPMPLKTALGDLERVLESPSLFLLHETERHSEVMCQVMRTSGATGNLVHDAHIAALCLEHGVAELLTGDREFARFEGLSVRDPFGR